MRAGTVADLLADLIGPAVNASRGATAAKAANPATSEQPCELDTESGHCEALRISANPERRTPTPDANSQEIAGIRNPHTGAQIEQTSGPSQDSQDSQGVVCIPAFGVAKRGRYSLTKAEGDAAHAEPWDNAACARFAARVGLFLRRGIDATDADDLAERLHLRDVQGDDRGMCLECSRLDRRGRCLAAAAGEVLGVGKLLEPVQTILLRCEAFELHKGLT